MFTTLAKNYAQSLFASNTKCQRDLDKLATISQDALCRSFILDPDSSIADIKTIFYSVIEKNKYLDAFLDILIHNKRCYLLPQIAAAYQHISLSARGITPVSVRSAYKLSSNQKNMLTQLVQESLGPDTQPDMEYSLDPKLIAACQIQYNNTVLDLSLQAQLEHLQQHILGVTYG